MSLWDLIYHSGTAMDRTVRPSLSVFLSGLCGCLVHHLIFDTIHFVQYKIYKLLYTEIGEIPYRKRSSVP